MHNATIESSPRLQRVLALLQSRGSAGATTREIVVEAEVMAVSAVVSELRANKVDIQCEMEGRGRFRYRLIPAAPIQGDLFGRTA